MIKKYFYIFFPVKKKKWKNISAYGFSQDYWKKKVTRKYKKRKKNIFQKLWKKLSFFSKLPTWISSWILWFMIVLCWVFVLFYSQYTSIDKINIYREWALIDINRAYSLLDYLRGKNLLAADSKNIAGRLQKSQSSISTIRINKDFPNTINIYLDSYGVLFQTESHYILENGSIVLKESNDFPDTQIIYLSQDISEYIDFEKKLDVNQLQLINELISESSRNILGFIPAQVYFFIKEREVIIKDNLGTLYIFDLEQDINKQIRQLAIYDTESSDIKRDSYTYIDVRVSDKLFLCSWEMEDTCNNNIQQIYWDTIFQNPLPEVSESLQ